MEKRKAVKAVKMWAVQIKFGRQWHFWWVIDRDTFVTSPAIFDRRRDADEYKQWGECDEGREPLRVIPVSVTPIQGAARGKKKSKR